VQNYGHASVFGGQAIDLYENNAYRSIAWQGRRNWSTQFPFSVRLRIIPQASGFPIDTTNIFTAANSQGIARGGMFIWWFSDGTFQLTSFTNSGTVAFNRVTTTPVSGVAGQAMDIMFSFSGSNNANGCKFSIDGVLNDQFTASVDPTAYDSERGYNSIKSIYLGFSTITYFALNELTIWDTEEPVVYAARTGFESISAFDELANTDPGQGNVRSGTGYVSAGVAKTGTVNIPSLENTKVGVSGDGGVGTYNGSDRWTSPAPGQLALGVQLKSNSTTANLTGTLDSVTNYLVGGDLEGQSTEAVLELS
jgi:hypothetical protein